MLEIKLTPRSPRFSAHRLKHLLLLVGKLRKKKLEEP